jgi:uncharacterized iron-regulated membrane protein
MRKLLLKLHLWTGLAAALPLIIVGVTGALLVYGEEIDRAVDRQLFYVTPGTERLPAQVLLETVQAAYPAEKFVGCSPPSEANRSYMFYSTGRNYMYVDPYTGRVLGAKALHTGLRRKMFLIHSQLMAGKVGHTIVVASTIISIFLIVTGVVLWWKFKIFGVKWRAGWWRLNFDLHSVLGLYSAVVFLILSVTGVAIAYESAVYPAILRASGAPPVRPPTQSVPRDAPTISLDTAIAAGERQLPGARVTVVGLPVKPTDVFSVYGRYPEDTAASGKSRVRVDRYTGDVLSYKSTREANWGQYLVDTMESIHFGDIFGTPTRIIAFVISLLVAGQVVSGVVIWWKKA